MMRFILTDLFKLILKNQTDVPVVTVRDDVNHPARKVVMHIFGRLTDDARHS
jgi:hypothetical protein